MYFNIFKRRWISVELLNTLKELTTKNYEGHIIKGDLTTVDINQVEGNERDISSIILTHGDDRLIHTIKDNSLTKNKDHFQFKLNDFLKFRPNKTANVDTVKETTTATMNDLGIDNDIDTRENAITFFLNEYNNDERETIINYLKTVDANSADVIIEIDLRNATQAQIDAHMNMVELAKIKL